MKNTHKNTREEEPIIISRSNRDEMLPKNFIKTLSQQFFPVLALCYIITVLGYAAYKHDIITHLLQSRRAYVVGLAVMLWVSMPGFVWIFIRSSQQYRKYANEWYKIIAGLMTLTLLIAYLLFPEANTYALKIYLISSIPLLILQYWLFVKNGLPDFMAYPLIIGAVILMCFGSIAHFIF